MVSIYLGYETVFLMSYALNRFYACLLVGLKIQMEIISRSILLGSQITYGLLKMEKRCRSVLIFNKTIIESFLSVEDYISLYIEL